METIILKDSVTGNMSDEEFLRFCLENPDLRIERNSNLEIIIMSPVSTLSGYSSSAAFAELALWNKKSGRGIVFDSSTGFTLPDRSVLSPDVSWVSKEAWNKLSIEDKDRFAPICPAFVIEIMSKSDSLDDLTKKMKTWIKNGAVVAWLIDPRREVSYIFRQNKPEEKIEGFDKVIKGEGPAEGFELDLSLLKI